MSDILLLQPRHVYAPDYRETQLGHVYMPTSLLTVCARLLTAGVNVTFEDENLNRSELNCPLVGINLVGSPYVIRGREIRDRLRSKYDTSTLLLGGQVVSGFRAEELSNLFGQAALNGNEDGNLLSVLRYGSLLPRPEHTSLVLAYSLIDDREMTMYLNNEFCFFLSSGCKYGCVFCAAHHTRRDENSGVTIRVRETYRSQECIEADLSYLMDRAARLGIKTLRFYLSNLDLFQSPVLLKAFAETVFLVRNRHPEVVITMRGLSTVKSFLDVHKNSPEVISTMVAAGLERVGFGVDGATAEIFRKTRKPQQTPTTCGKAIQIAREEYHMTPETLMVFGHVGADTEDSLHAACVFTEWAKDKYGSLPRPHVAKSVIPGNKGWQGEESLPLRQRLLQNPNLFQLLDFTALPTSLTHPDDLFRNAITESFLEICKLQGVVTQYVLPEWPCVDHLELDRIRAFNMGRYDV
jgi:Radical SAM superfamily